MYNTQGNLVRRRRGQGRRQTTVPGISRHMRKREAATATDVSEDTRHQTETEGIQETR